MNKFLFIIILIILIIIIRLNSHEKMYGDWQYKSNYPIGEYDPAMAGVEFTRSP